MLHKDFVSVRQLKYVVVADIVKTVFAFFTFSSTYCFYRHVYVSVGDHGHLFHSYVATVDMQIAYKAGLNSKATFYSQESTFCFYFATFITRVHKYYLNSHSEHSLCYGWHSVDNLAHWRGLHRPEY